MATSTKQKPLTCPDDPVNRDVLLALAERCRRSGNIPLRDLLLTVAGSVRSDGRIVNSEWRSMCRLGGSYGIGLMLANRHRYDTVQEPVRGGLAALDEQVRVQAHGWSYTPIGELGLGDEFIEFMDDLVITTIGELVAYILNRGPGWAEEPIVLGVEIVLGRFRETLLPEQQAAFDLARKPPDLKEKRPRKQKEAS